MSAKRKQPTKVVAPTIKASAKPALKAKIDDSKTSVLAGASIPASSANDPIAISSDSDSDDDLELTDDEAIDEQLAADKAGAKQNGVVIKAKDTDTDMQTPPPAAAEDTEDPDASDAEPDVPTFGDMIRAHETIDVAGSSSTLAQTANGTALAPAQNQLRIIAPPSTSSLGTVLNQALRTDDADLLESCLHTTDLTTVRNTIQRMDSDLAATLLAKLAARMHRRPGRAHSLMSWVQWTLIAHGGALAHQDDIVRKLGDLNRVLDERARGLNSLLSLKGKLDMLEAQMQLRRANKGGRRGAQEDSDDEEEEDEEEGIIYVEGEEDEEPSALMNGLLKNHEEDDEFPLSNGIADSEEDSDADSDDEVDMDEPELTDRESLDADEVDHEDVDESADEDDSDVEPAPPTKLRKKGAAAFSKRK